MKRKLEYIDKGRYGQVVYKDEQGTLQFYYEFGGGDCVATINIPSVAEWISQTNRPLAERDEILNFVGEQATKDQVRNGYYQIKEVWIEIMTK